MSRRQDDFEAGQAKWAEQMDRLKTLEVIDRRARDVLIGVIAVRCPDVMDEALAVLERRHPVDGSL